ncbi:tumor necrosis factor receptor superfamily member 5-like isoform X2 [Rhinoraja longicauda]
MCFLAQIFFILFLLCQLSQVTACDKEKYEYNGVCCSLCRPGTVVAKHCTVNTGTVCTPCANGRFISQPNGIQRCFSCMKCYADLGIQIKRQCTKTRNSVCGPLDGYYCIENCRMAHKHTSCPPGSGAKVKGTELKDSICEKCQKGMFSSSSSPTEECKNWTIRKSGPDQIWLGRLGQDV